MAYLISHLLLLYLLSLILAGIAYAVIDISDPDAGVFILSAICAALTELIARLVRNKATPRNRDKEEIM